MRNITGCAVAALLWLGPGSLMGQTRYLAYDVDLRPPVEGDASLGLDFDVRLAVARQQAEVRGHQFDASAFTKGFWTFGNEPPDVDHISAGFLFGGRYYSNARSELDARQQDRILHLLDKDLTDLTEGEAAELNRLTTLQSRYYNYAAAYRYEATQDRRVGQHVLGIQVAGEIPLLRELLDAVPALTRFEDGYRPQPLRMAAALDLVSGVDSAFVGAEDHDAAMGRLRMEAAWSTKILEGLPLRVTWEGHVLFGGPETVEAMNRGFNSFVQAWILVPLSESGRSGVMVKYINGRLPPLYESANGAELGLSFAVY
jgi:hypothetical protein